MSYCVVCLEWLVRVIVSVKVASRYREHTIDVVFIRDHEDNSFLLLQIFKFHSEQIQDIIIIENNL